MRAHCRWLCLLAPWWALSAAGAWADDASNWERLRSMPRERRQALLENLEQFDALSPNEKSAVRALNAKIASLPAADQARYRSVLRRYHLWVQSLPEAQRNQLKAAAPEERMKLIAKFRADERVAAPRRRSSPSLLQVVDFGASTPFEMARQIRVWQKLTPEQRGTLEKITNPVEAQQKFRELSKDVDVKAERKILKNEEDALIARAEAHLQEKGGIDTTLIKRKDAQKDARLKKRLAENFYFIENPPPPVKPENLLRFESSLPAWIRLPFDHLPADEARRRLTILYRLIYPPGQEMPVPKPAATTKEAPPKPKPAPVRTPPKSSTPTPF